MSKELRWFKLNLSVHPKVTQPVRLNQIFTCTRPYLTNNEPNCGFELITCGWLIYIYPWLLIPVKPNRWRWCLFRYVSLFIIIGFRSGKFLFDFILIIQILFFPFWYRTDCNYRYYRSLINNVKKIGLNSERDSLVSSTP